MRLNTLFLSLALVSTTTSAYRVSFKQKKTKHQPTLDRRGENSASASQANVGGNDNVGLDLECVSLYAATRLAPDHRPSTVHDLIYMANVRFLYKTDEQLPISSSL